MTVLAASHLKNRLGEVLDTAQREPVVISRNGRNIAVVISQEDYERWQALEDRYWSDQAREGEASGFLTPEETMAFIKRRLAEVEALDR